mgnify:CR=1 FL=1
MKHITLTIFALLISITAFTQSGTITKEKNKFYQDGQRFYRIVI